MRILFEECQYEEALISSFPDEIKALCGNGRDNRNKLQGVGYYNNGQKSFYILPKVFPKECNIEDTEQHDIYVAQHKEQLSQIGIWLYQAIDLFCKRKQDNSIAQRSDLSQIISNKTENEATLLDLIISLRRFHHEHQDLFTRISLIKHSGYNKVHWQKTISTTQPIIQKDTPIYLNLKTKQKEINYEEELICLFYSTLTYLSEEYYFKFTTNLNYSTLPPHQVKSLIDSGKGTRKLKQIRGKYFSDTFVALWKLLYAFYSKAEKAASKHSQPEYLLIKNFNIIFEDMVDCLISDHNLPSGLKEQKDGKVVDHLYLDQSLVDEDDSRKIYFIADSKYYGIDSTIGENSVYKQFTYAKNVIQWHIDKDTNKDTKRYQDPITEGYNPTPSFFIKAKVDNLDNLELNLNYTGDEDIKWNTHFKHRLFDRDTLILLTYEINLLYVLKEYISHSNTGGSIHYEIRTKFRSKIIEIFNKEYALYDITPTEEIEGFVKKHFRELVGKIYCTKSQRLLLAKHKEDKTLEAFLKDKTPKSFE